MDFRFDMSIPNKSYNQPVWTADNSDWKKVCKAIAQDESRPWIDRKSEMIVNILKNAPISVNTDDIFPYLIKTDNFMGDLRTQRHQTAMAKLRAEWKFDFNHTEFSIYPDFSHSSPDWDFIVKNGLVGIRQILSEKEKTTENAKFYQNAIMIIDAVFDLINRFIKLYEKDCDKPSARFTIDNLKALLQHEPRTLAQAFQLYFIIYWVVDQVEFVGIRSFGRIDKTLLHLYESDLKSGVYTKQDEETIIRFFYGQITAMNHPNNIPICLGGCDSINGGISHFTRELLRIYNDMNIYSPKIQLRICEDTPKDIIREVLDNIRKGNNSYVLENDPIVIESLVKIGIDRKDAVNYIPIGCYEQAAQGTELPCTSNGFFIMPHAVQRAIGVNDIEKRFQGEGQIKEYEDFDSFYTAIKSAFKETVDCVLDLMNSAIDPICNIALTSPLYSVFFPPCIENGRELYEGGAKYNNNSLCLVGFSTAIDSIMAIKQLVFDEKKFTLSQFRQMINCNWEGYEKERLYIQNRCKKYGNQDEFTDRITADFTSYCMKLVNNKPNRRGGVFRAGLWSINGNQTLGALTGATADGRKKGEPLNKNLSATIGMDKNGAISLIKSVTSIDATLAPNGAVLDLTLHPSAVHGEKGLDAFVALVEMFFADGGQAIQINVLDYETLKKAQQEPEKYSTLQIRVCGWNSYFVNLSKQDQDIFIKTSEGLC